MLTRWGLAIARPRWALALAGDRRFAGRSGSDLVVLLLALLAATELRWLAKAIWLGVAVDAGVGFRAAMHVVTRSVMLPLGALVVAALAIFATAGGKRELGRAFDLACVVVVPIVLVNLALGIAGHAFDFAPPPIATYVLSAALFAWCVVLLALAIAVERRATAAEVVVDPAALPPAKLAGYALLLAIAGGLVLEANWLSHNADDIRPIDTGDAAPTLVLAPIDDAGGLTMPRDLLADRRGKVVVVDFWATWCGPCLASMPHLDIMSRKYQDLAIVAVNLDDAVAARKLFTQRGFAKLALVADDGATSERYGVSTIPHTVVIDRAGKVRAVFRGASAELEPLVASLLK